MSKMTEPRSTVKPPLAVALVAMRFSIGATRYVAQPIPPGEFGTAAYRINKLGPEGESYDVIRTHEGLVECSCPDYECRHRGLDADCCKHGRAAVEMGLLDAPRSQVGISSPADMEAEPEPSSIGVAEGDRMTLAEFIEGQAGRYRLLETAAGDLVAGAIAELARSVRFHGAETPAEYMRSQGLAELERRGREEPEGDGA
jgi:hypothetical protein